MGKITLPLKFFFQILPPNINKEKTKWDHNAYADICPPKHSLYVEVIKNQSYPLIYMACINMHWWASPWFSVMCIYRQISS